MSANKEIFKQKYRDKRTDNRFSEFRDWFSEEQINSIVNDFYKSKEKLPNTKYAANHTLCLPLHQNLTNKEVILTTLIFKMRLGFFTIILRTMLKMMTQVLKTERQF